MKTKEQILESLDEILEKKVYEKECEDCGKIEEDCECDDNVNEELRKDIELAEFKKFKKQISGMYSDFLETALEDFEANYLKGGLASKDASEIKKMIHADVKRVKV